MSGYFICEIRSSTDASTIFLKGCLTFFRLKLGQETMGISSNSIIETSSGALSFKPLLIATSAPNAIMSLEEKIQSALV